MQSDDDELTPAQQEAVRDLDVAVQAVAQAERALHAAIAARALTVQRHAPVFRAMRWRRVARIVGGVTESTLRADARTRVEEEN